MAKCNKVMTLSDNAAGGIDLLIERDSGNLVRILNGNKKHSLAVWTVLATLANLAISELEA